MFTLCQVASTRVHVAGAVLHTSVLQKVAEMWCTCQSVYRSIICLTSTSVAKVVQNHRSASAGTTQLISETSGVRGLQRTATFATRDFEDDAVLGLLQHESTTICTERQPQPRLLSTTLPVAIRCSTSPRLQRAVQHEETPALIDLSPLVDVDLLVFPAGLAWHESPPLRLLIRLTELAQLLLNLSTGLAVLWAAHLHSVESLQGVRNTCRLGRFTIQTAARQKAWHAAGVGS